MTSTLSHTKTDHQNTKERTKWQDTKWNKVSRALLTFRVVWKFLNYAFSGFLAPFYVVVLETRPWRRSLGVWRDHRLSSWTRSILKGEKIVEKRPAQVSWLFHGNIIFKVIIISKSVSEGRRQWIGSNGCVQNIDQFPSSW